MKTRMYLSLLLSVAVLQSCSRDAHIHPSGTLEATEVSLSLPIAGKVVEVRKSEGNTVNAGDTLLVLDTELLDLQKKQSGAQLNELNSVRSALQAQQTQTKLQLKNLTDKLERQRKLLDKGSSSLQMVDDLTTQRDIAAAQFSAFDAQIKANQAQQERVSAVLAAQGRQLRDATLTAPSNGVVLVRNAEKGETVTPSTVVFKIADISTLSLKIYLTEHEMSKVKLGQELKLEVDALPERKFTGRVSYISPIAEFTPKNIQTKTTRADLVFAVKLNVENPDGALHGGMPAEIILP